MNGEGIGQGQDAVVRVWLYARSALDNQAALADRLDVLATVVAAHGMAEAGRSFDTGSGLGPLCQGQLGHAEELQILGLSRARLDDLSP